MNFVRLCFLQVGYWENFCFFFRMCVLIIKFNDYFQEVLWLFDCERFGFVMGEGVGIMILEVNVVLLEVEIFFVYIFDIEEIYCYSIFIFFLGI